LFHAAYPVCTKARFPFHGLSSPASGEVGQGIKRRNPPRDPLSYLYKIHLNFLLTEKNAWRVMWTYESPTSGEAGKRIKERNPPRDQSILIT